MIKVEALISKKQCFMAKAIFFNLILYSLDNCINDIIVFNLKLKNESFKNHIFNHYMNTSHAKDHLDQLEFYIY
jgi:hypothetical protein